MVYQIKNTRGQIVSTVSDYGTDNSTSLELIGRGVSNYGLIEQSNLLHLLENFASPVEPTNPVEGQLWFNTSTSDQILSVYYDDTWNNLMTVVSSATPPTNVSGLWIDTNSNSLFFASNGKWIGSSSFFVSETPPPAVLNTGLTWLMIPEYILWTYDSTISTPIPSFKRIGGTSDGTYLSGSWRMIGTQYPINAGMKSYYASVSDTSSNFHDVIVNEINNNIISVESKDNFTMSTTASNALPNFTSLDTSLNVTTTNPKIYSGITLNQSVPSNIFGGLSLGVLNFDITDVVGRGKNLSLRPTTPISDSTIDLGSSTVRWRNFYSNNIYASSNIQINGDNVATQPWVDDTLSSTITLATTSTFNTNGLVSLYRQSSTTTDDILELYSNVGGTQTLVSKIEADGSIDVVGSGHLKDHGSRVVVTDPILSTEIQALNIVADPTNNHIRITDSSNNKWDLTTSSYNSNNFLSKNSKTLTNYSSGVSLSFDNTESFPYFEYNSTGTYLSTKSYVDSVTTNSYITNHVNISSDPNNLLRNSSDGLLVELSSAQTVYYISSSSGSDTNDGASSSTPLKTIREAINRTPDYTTITLLLKSGDTFKPEDGAGGTTIPTTYAKVTTSTIDIQNRNIYIQPYGSSKIDQYITAWNGLGGYSPQVDLGSERPVIEFTFFNTTDTVISYKMAVGFVVSGSGSTGSLQISSCTLKVTDTTNTTSVTYPSGGFGCFRFEGKSSSIFFLGCYIYLSNLLMFTPFNGTSISIDGYTYFDKTNGAGFLQGQCSISAPYSDNTSVAVKGPDGSPITGLYTMAQNFNSSVANNKSILGLVVIDSNARIYEYIITQNKLDN